MSALKIKFIFWSISTGLLFLITIVQYILKHVSLNSSSQTGAFKDLLSVFTKGDTEKIIFKIFPSAICFDFFLLSTSSLLWKWRN
jgi:hypothetical protein